MHCGLMVRVPTMAVVAVAVAAAAVVVAVVAAVVVVAVVVVAAVAVAVAVDQMILLLEVKNQLQVFLIWEESRPQASPELVVEAVPAYP